MYSTMIILGSYIVLMGVQCFRAKQLQYLWSAIILWFGIGLIGARLLPGIYSIYKPVGYYLSPLFFCIGSLFYFAYACRFHFNRQEIALESDQHIFLGALTFANFFVQCGFLLLTSVVWLFYPLRLQQYFLPDIFTQYTLQPVWIIGLMLTVTTIIVLHTRLNQRNTIKLSVSQSFLFCCLIALTVTIKMCGAQLTEIIKRILPALL